jgi:hypothetical protein
MRGQWPCPTPPRPQEGFRSPACRAGRLSSLQPWSSTVLSGELSGSALHPFSERDLHIRTAPFAPFGCWTGPPTLIVSVPRCF